MKRFEAMKKQEETDKGVLNSAPKTPSLESGMDTGAICHAPTSEKLTNASQNIAKSLRDRLRGFGMIRNRRMLRIAHISVYLLAGIVLSVLGVVMMIDTPRSYAQDESSTPTPTGDNAYCVICHTKEATRELKFADGYSISIAVDPDILANSVHGTSNKAGALGCIDCHGNNVFPHSNPPAASFREHQISTANLCIRCHQENAANLADDVHYTALVGGDLRAATCVDCHGGHDIQPPDEPRSKISRTCGNCHQIVFAQYKNSIHGQTLFDDNNPDVPTCIDCHGVHGINHPTTALFRNRSPLLCTKCHGDKALMEKYGISTNILESYLTDFHGTTVEFFQQDDPNVASNKAVCYDCHGVHDIAKVDSASSHVIRQNLLTTCQECHPNATADFPDAWLGHYAPTFETHPLVTTVNIFYAIFIPLTIGGFIFLVGTDIIRIIRNFFRRRD